MVSMMDSSVVVLMTVSFSGFPGRFAHWVSGWDHHETKALLPAGLLLWICPLPLLGLRTQ